MNLVCLLSSCGESWVDTPQTLPWTSIDICPYTFASANPPVEPSLRDIVDTAVQIPAPEHEGKPGASAAQPLAEISVGKRPGPGAKDIDESPSPLPGLC
jgi:hypothetical protein